MESFSIVLSLVGFGIPQPGNRMTEPRRNLSIPNHVKGLLKRHNQPQPTWYVGTLHAENGRDITTRSAGKMPKDLERPLDVRRPGGDPDSALRDG